MLVGICFRLGVVSVCQVIVSVCCGSWACAPIDAEDALQLIDHAPDLLLSFNEPEHEDLCSRQLEQAKTLIEVNGHDHIMNHSWCFSDMVLWFHTHDFDGSHYS